jgi:hypothetical protein
VAAGDSAGVSAQQHHHQQHQQEAVPSTHGLALYGPRAAADTPLADFDQRRTSRGMPEAAVSAHPLSISMQIGQGTAGGGPWMGLGAERAMSTSGAGGVQAGGGQGGAGGGGGLKQSFAAAQAELRSWLQRSASLQQRLSQEMVKHDGRMQALTARQQLVEGILANLENTQQGQQQQGGAEGGGGDRSSTAAAGGGGAGDREQRSQAHKSHHLR